jgi:hypothetical protein
VTEPFVIATERQLASTHPVGILLRPHFEGTLFINNAAQEFLIASQGGVDALLAATIDADRVYAAKSVQGYVFNDAMLPTALKLRGVDDPTQLPVYPYRDDALLIWNAIHKWASDYLAIYYRTDADVQADFELQNWVAELLSHDGGRIQGVGQDGRVQTRDYLADAVTLIIFTASAQACGGKLSAEFHYELCARDAARRLCARALERSWGDPRGLSLVVAFARSGAKTIECHLHTRLGLLHETWRLSHVR